MDNISNFQSVSPNPINMYGIKNAIEVTALKYLNFNDPIINYMATIIVLSLIGTLMVKIDKIPNIIINLFHKFYSIIYNVIFKLYHKFKKEKIKKFMIIEKITDDRQINPLYHALSWYLMNQVNLDEEDFIKYSIESKISETSEKKPDLFKRVMQDSIRKLSFNNKNIYYKLSASSIKIDGENHDRRNDKIECWVYVYKKNDTFLDSFINFCLSEYIIYNKNKNSKKYVYQNMNGIWSPITTQEDRIEDTIVLKNNDKEVLFDEINHFIKNKDWYINHGFLYSLGILLYGEPGTGKTSLIRFLSNMTNRHTHYLRLTQIQSESEFNKLLKDVKLSETILVMEDIDCAGKIVHSRDKIYEDEQKKKEKRFRLSRN